MATARFLADQKPNGTAYVIGEGGLLTALHTHGYSIVDRDPDYVVIGEGRTLTFENVEAALGMILGGAKLVATNPDPNCPTGNGGTIPGFADLREIELLVEAGFTPVEAIRVATLNGAIYLGRDATIGSLAPGKNADLFVFNDVSRSDIGFDALDNEVVLLTATDERRIGKAPKQRIAAAILDEAQRLLKEANGRAGN